MRLRTALLATAGWTAVVLVLAGASLLGAWTRAEGAERERFHHVLPAMLGAAGTFVLIGCGIIWATWWARRS